MRISFVTALIAPCLLIGGVVACAEEAESAPAPAQVLIRNVRIFNGVDPQLTAGNILIEGDKIKEVSSDSIAAPNGATLIDGGGRVLSPGFIDLHAHITFQLPRDLSFGNPHPWIVGAVSAQAAEMYLMSGFTTVRDAGGTHPSLARAIEDGVFPGPRVYPSGAIISQTAGHGDFRAPHDKHPALDCCGGGSLLGHGFSYVVDGVPDWLAATRETLRSGATQIKIMGGGGVMSDYDPIHTLQPSPAEIRAAVQAASDWGTYVLAHSYTSEAVQRLVENGVKCIEHGLLIDDDTARICADNDVVISTQVHVFRMGGDLPGVTELNRKKLAQVLAGQDNLMKLIKKYKIKTGFGTDLIFGAVDQLGKEFTGRLDYFTPAEILRQATSESADIIRMCGKLNRHGNFGEIRDGWKADLLIFASNPLDDLKILETPAESIDVIIKDGAIVKGAPQPAGGGSEG